MSSWRWSLEAAIQSFVSQSQGLGKVAENSKILNGDAYQEPSKLEVM